MNPRDCIIAAFILAVFVGVAAMWLVDMQVRRQAAAESIEAVRVSLTPFERDKARAVEKINRIYGDGE